MIQVLAELNSLPLTVKKEPVRAFLKTLVYPLNFLDFETFQQVIPAFDGQKPYDQLPVQYSLHIQMGKGAEPVHKEYLAQFNVDPRREIAERLIADLTQRGSIIVYSQGFEKSIICRLRDLFPDLADELNSFVERLIDLEVPFSQKHVYTKELQGRSSIKKVLPALCKGDPELDYSALNNVHNGSDAMNAFASLSSKSEEEVHLIRKDLLAYCRLDTLAMVKILERLYDLAK